MDRYRVTCLVLGSLMCTTGIAKIAISGAGFLSTLTLAFISITGWKILSHKFDVSISFQVHFLIHIKIANIFSQLIYEESYIHFGNWHNQFWSEL